jgi:AcrR family transcriptional regulator
VVQFSNRRSTVADGVARVRRRADRRRLDILRAAARIFRQRGFAAAGMREIAVAADLSPANLYHYFRGKEELLFFCQDRALDRLMAALSDATAGHDALTLRLHRLAAAHVLCLVDAVEGSAAHFEVDALPPRLRLLIVAKRDRYERGVRRLVASGMRRGELTRGDATVATRAFLGALNWTASWFRPDGPYPPERVAELVADYAVAGLIGVNRESRTHRADRQRRAGGRRVRTVQNAARSPA